MKPSLDSMLGMLFYPAWNTIKTSSIYWALHWECFWLCHIRILRTQAWADRCKEDYISWL